MKPAYWMMAVALCASCKNKDEAKQKQLEQLDKKIEALDKMVASDKKAHKPTGTPRPQTALHVTVDGKPVEMATALAWKDRGEVRITVSSVPVACSDVTGNMREMYDGEVTFDVSMGSLLQPDGSQKPVIKSTYFQGMTQQRTSPPVTGSGDGTPGQPTKLDVDFKTESAGQDQHSIEVKGTIDALGCDVPPPSSAPPPPPPEMPATIEVAGKKLAIRSAGLSTAGTDWPQLALSTGGDACFGSQASAGELRIELTWFDKAKPEVSQVSLGGTMLANAIDQTYDKKKITIKPAPPTAPGEIALNADIKVMSFPLKLSGKVTAVACPK